MGCAPLRLFEPFRWRCLQVGLYFTPLTLLGSHVLRDRMHVFKRDHSSRLSKKRRELGRDLMD